MLHTLIHYGSKLDGYFLMLGLLKILLYHKQFLIIDLLMKTKQVWQNQSIYVIKACSGKARHTIYKLKVKNDY